MSAQKKKKGAAKRKPLVPTEGNSKVPTGDKVLENAGRKWPVRIGPMETAHVAENAPLCQMVVQNQGPATVEVRVENSEPMVLMPGKLSLMSAYGTIAIQSLEENWALVEMDFLPRTKAY